MNKKLQTAQISKDILAGPEQNLLIMAGPCQIESTEHCLMMASKIKKIADKYPVNFAFKSSFDKANRTSLAGARGVGLEQGIEILAEVKQQQQCPVITDLHLPEQAGQLAEVVDVLQIPAFLCRQTDLLLAAGETGRAINLKKGQFLAAADLKYAAEKIASTGNENIMLCERGTCFGYRDLIVDFRNLLIMRELGYPVVYDATHSVQVMGGNDGSSSGNRSYVKSLALAATTVGIDALFVEVHDNPDSAPSDGANMLNLEQFDDLLNNVCAIRLKVNDQI